jgi:FlaA1/EpsC-like NDP-sugar epimerase
MQAARIGQRLHLDPALSVFDAAVVVCSYVAVLILRFDGTVPMSWRPDFLRFLGIALFLHLASNAAWGLYRQMWRHASVREATRVLKAGATASGVLILYVIVDHPVPLSVAVLGAFVATMMMGGLRFQARLFEFHRRGTDAAAGLRIVVVGAGEAGAAILREMRRTPASGLVPVALVDDDPRKQGLSLLGVPVVGSTSELCEVVERFEAHRVVLAIPGAGQGLVARVADHAEAAEVPLQVLPGFGELMRDHVSLRDVRDLRIEDLIGREEVKIDFDAVERLIRGARVLVTGGGGSIGSEIARQVAMCEPSRLVLLDHDETHLHDTVATIRGNADCALADVRDPVRVRDVFESLRPEIVFHAAAHKHVPMLEAQACEAVETNVFGTAAVVAAAEEFGTERVVFISTDKAVRPSSVMGASKWLAEQVVLGRTGGRARYCAVRFGNVLGSRGSVIPTFQRQIADGGPVTVTDPRMTRYFMTIEEAVRLVLQAAVFAEGGEVFMLEMGRAVNIMDLAKRMIRLSGRRPGIDVAIEIVGTRRGEKLTEELSAPSERKSLTAHEAVVRLDVEHLPPRELGELLADLEEMTTRKDHAEAARSLLGRANGPGDGAAPEVIDLAAIERAEGDLAPSVIRWFPAPGLETG